MKIKWQKNSIKKKRNEKRIEILKKRGKNPCE